MTNLTEQDLLDKFVEIVENSHKIVFFGGAGVSTESGIPDFRSTDGLYNTKYDYQPETILSDEFFYAHTEEFYRFYRDKMLYLSAKPNVTHFTLARLEALGKLSAVVTQNIDGLHEAAGSKRVYNLHGTVYRNHCLKCGAEYGVEAIVESDGVPRCKCGGVIKPDVVLYGEALPEEAVEGAVRAIVGCDTLIVGGTSLTVYPAAGYLRYFRGQNLVLINKQQTQLDGRADLVMHMPLGQVFGALADKLDSAK